MTTPKSLLRCLDTVNQINQLYLHCMCCAQVASQCLQSAYALNTDDKHLAVSKPLQAIFQEATKNEPVGCFTFFIKSTLFFAVAKEVSPLGG